MDGPSQYATAFWAEEQSDDGSQTRESLRSDSSQSGRECQFHRIRLAFGGPFFVKMMHDHRIGTDGVRQNRRERF
jgi:hypothetical protein